MGKILKALKKVSIGDAAALTVLLFVGIVFYGCTLDDVVNNSKIGEAAVSATLEAADPIVSAVETTPGYEGIAEETVSKVETGLKTTNKNLGRATAVLTVAKTVAPQAAVYVEPALAIISLLGMGVTSLIGFVANRKRKKAEKITGVVMKAVNPVKGIGALIAQAAKDEQVSDETHKMYRKHVEA